MSISRRKLIGGGAALAGAGAVAAFGQPSSAEPEVVELSAAELEALDIPVMLSVTDVHAGELEILIGEQAIAFTDRPLVARLARAATQEVM